MMKMLFFLWYPTNLSLAIGSPLVIGTCTIGRIINVIQESEIDHLSMPWATAQMAQLLSCQKSTVVSTPESTGEAQSEGVSGDPRKWM